MRLTRGKCKINGIHIVDVQIDRTQTLSLDVSLGKMNTLNAMTATYATVEGKEFTTGINTHGKCSAYQDNWSKETLDLLKTLLGSMEEDLLHRHFEESVEGNDARLVAREDEDTTQI